jgi:hypothetical protein
MQTADKLRKPGDIFWNVAQRKREAAARLIHEAEQIELEVITLWATQELSPCYPSASSASPLA